MNSANVVTPTGAIMNNLFTETYLRVVDQAGMSGTFPLFGKNYAEGNLGYLRSTTAGDRMGGTLRLIFPVSNKIAFTLEGGMNETLLGPGNNGRVVAGLQFGSPTRPKDYLDSPHPVPVQIPRVRYEVLTRTVRKGNAAPVADAGPNQILPGAQTVTLNGSASYDPDGDPITFQWVQEVGAGRDAFGAYRRDHHFRRGRGAELQLPPDGEGSLRRAGNRAGEHHGGDSGVVGAADRRFHGESDQHQCRAIVDIELAGANADTVTITSLGTVALTGSQAVTPATTTTYTLTATHGSQTATANATVTVNTGNWRRTAGDRQLRAESGYHRFRAELGAVLGGAERYHGDRQHHRDSGAYRLALDFAGGDH